ncbi:MAG: DNA-binding domain-containing protein [Gallionella sp.]
MTDWSETLKEFSAAIRTGADMPSDVLADTGYPAERGIEVYRNNYRGNLHDTLAAVYPVVRQLVGDEFFRMMAKKFIEGHPSRSGNLHDYGSELAEFLEHFEPTTQLAYLPGMASLEWAYHRAYLADDAPDFDVERLATLAPESYAELRWQLHPSCSLLVTDHPTAAIWQAHQEGASDDFNIDIESGGDRLLVFRNQLITEIISIEAGSLHWLVQLQQGIPMGKATEATLAVYSGFDLTTTLRHWLAQGVLINFNILQGE